MAAATASTQVVVVAMAEAHLEGVRAVALDMAGAVADMVEADTAAAVCLIFYLGCQLLPIRSL